MLANRALMASLKSKKSDFVSFSDYTGTLDTGVASMVGVYFYNMAYNSATGVFSCNGQGYTSYANSGNLCRSAQTLEVFDGVSWLQVYYFLPPGGVMNYQANAVPYTISANIGAGKNLTSIRFTLTDNGGSGSYVQTKLFSSLVTPDAISKTGLIAEYTMESVTGNVITDTSGNGYDANIAGSGASIVVRDSGHALQFGGAGGVPTTFQQNTGLDFTLSWWGYIPITDGARFFGSATSIDPNFSVEYSPTAMAIVHMDGNRTNVRYQVAFNFTLLPAAWMHFVWVRRSTDNGSLYMDGAEVTSKTIYVADSHISLPMNQPLGFGDLRSTYGYLPNGSKMDKIRLYNRALALSEITALYQEVA